MPTAKDKETCPKCHSEKALTKSGEDYNCFYCEGSFSAAALAKLQKSLAKGKAKTEAKPKEDQ